MKDLYFIGDIHNNVPELIDRIRKFNIKSSILIQLGDFGIGFPQVDYNLYEETYYGLSLFLLKRNCIMYVIRGNHDNPRYFDGKFEYNDTLKFVKDYDILNIENHNILCIGGGISVDRTYRKKYNQGWWKDEIVDYDLKKVENIKNVDIVVSHSAPSFVYPHLYNDPNIVLRHWMDEDKDLWDDVVKERSYLENVYKKLTLFNTINYWFYGHFHQSNTQLIDKTNFKLLNIYEFYKF